MYDNYLYSREYKPLKDKIADILHGDDTTTDVQDLAVHIQQIYEAGDLSSTQYDDLMSYLQDMLL